MIAPDPSSYPKTPMYRLGLIPSYNVRRSKREEPSLGSVNLLAELLNCREDVVYLLVSTYML